MANTTITINKGILNDIKVLSATACAANMEIAPVKDSKTVYIFNNTSSTDAMSVKINAGEGWGAGKAITLSLATGKQGAVLIDGSRFKKNDGKIYIDVTGTGTVTAIQI